LTSLEATEAFLKALAFDAFEKALKNLLISKTDFKFIIEMKCIGLL